MSKDGAGGCFGGYPQERKVYIKEPDSKLIEAKKALKLAYIRLDILTGRMRACNEETGKHELLDEAEAFVKEAKEAYENI